MKKILIYVILLGIIGLILGYLFFGKIGGDYVSVKAIFGASGNALESLGIKVSGLAKIKQKILISGGVGALAGLVLAIVRKK